MKSHFKLFALVATFGLLGTAIGIGVSLPAARAQDQAEEKKDERIFMLNVLWFKEDGGAEKYQDYIRAASPFVVKHGGKGGQAFIPDQAMIGDFDADLFFVVEWPNMQSFMGLVQDPGYQKISHLREEAITDSLLVRCKPAQ